MFWLLLVVEQRTAHLFSQHRLLLVLSLPSTTLYPSATPPLQQPSGHYAHHHSQNPPQAQRHKNQLALCIQPGEEEEEEENVEASFGVKQTWLEDTEDGNKDENKSVGEKMENIVFPGVEGAKEVGGGWKARSGVHQFRCKEEEKETFVG